MNRLLSVGAVALLTSAAFAAPVTPTFDTFGVLPGATFGGSGISNTRVAQTTAASGVTIALSATPRFGGPAVTDNGAGVYTAQVGVSPIPPSPGDPYAQWNFNLYVGDTAAVDDLGFRLFWDFDPWPAPIQQRWASSASTARIWRTTWPRTPSTSAWTSSRRTRLASHRRPARSTRMRRAGTASCSRPTRPRAQACRKWPAWRSS